jgi:hypothetical protein
MEHPVSETLQVALFGIVALLAAVPWYRFSHLLLWPRPNESASRLKTAKFIRWYGTLFLVLTGIALLATAIMDAG